MQLLFAEYAVITAIQQKRSYHWLYQFQGWVNIFAVLTIFGPLFPLFCDALRMSKTRIGFILSILPISYLLSIFISSWVMRRGPKKIMILFYFIRNWFILLLPLAGWIAGHFGDNAAFFWVAMIIFVFAVFRAVAETGFWPWMLELIPAKVRGKVDAVGSMSANIGAIIASLVAVLIMKNWPGMPGYNIAITVGVLFGFIALAFAWRLPGGESQIVEKKDWALVDEISAALRNARFKTWLKGSVPVVMILAAFGFFPLYLSGRIGFGSDKIMLFSGCFQAGVLLSAFLWGWNADRFGSKPVFMSALAGLCLAPFLFFLLPRMDEQSIVGTGFVYAFLGVVWQGWAAGANRYFFVTVLPTTQNPAFCSSLNLSLQSVIFACCSLFYGWLLDNLQSVRYDWFFIHLDNFTAMFMLMFLCCAGAMFFFRSAPSDSGVRTGDFVSLFFQGNPILAFSSIVRYHLSEDETRRMELTRRMGDAKSHLTVEELLQAADDPSFNVRYEAIVSMARMPSDDKLISALSAAVKSREPGLSEAAVWALGRMGDACAVPILREMLKCEYALLRSQCARALAKLNDQASIPEIMEAFKSEKNDNICAGYAAALGRFRKSDSLPQILALLRRLSDEHLRGEVALSVARIMGGEHHFVNLWRRSRSDFETVCAEELMIIKRRIKHSLPHAEGCLRFIAEAVRYFEQRNLPEAAAAVNGMLKLVRTENVGPLLGSVLDECDEMIAKHGGTRGDYILLALCAFHIAVTHLVKNKLSS